MNIGVDLGGTKVRVGIVDDGRILKILSEETKSGGSEEEVLGQLEGMLAACVSDCSGAIGIGVPAIVDPATGVVRDVVAIPSWKEVPLKSILEKQFSRPVSVNNDCNCFALGECRYGKAAEYSKAVYVTLGTGVGCSLVVDGLLYGGANLGAGELGNVPYLDKDYEFYCSSRFFESKGFSGKGLADKAGSGDAAALKIWDEFGGHIGRLVALVCYAYDPEAIVFGGSIAKAFEYFEGGMRRCLDEHFLYPNSLSRLAILTSEQDNMGLIGASLIAEDSIK